MERYQNNFTKGFFNIRPQEIKSTIKQEQEQKIKNPLKVESIKNLFRTGILTNVETFK